MLARSVCIYVVRYHNQVDNVFSRWCAVSGALICVTIMTPVGLQFTVCYTAVAAFRIQGRVSLLVTGTRWE